MSKRRNQILLLAGVLLLAGLLCAVLANREPRRAGHPLSYWLETYAAAKRASDDSYHPGQAEERRQRDVASQVVRDIGTNAIPTLLAWLSYEPSSLWRFRNSIYGFWLPDWIGKNRLLHFTSLGCLGFELLGERGSPAIPALSRLAYDARETDRAHYATRSLCAIGPSALGALLSILTNGPPESRITAAAGLRDFGTNALPAVPGMIQCLRYPNVSVASSSAFTLVKLGLQPEVTLPALTNALSSPDSAVRAKIIRALRMPTPRADIVLPALTNALHDPDPRVREEATNALREITTLSRR